MCNYVTDEYLGLVLRKASVWGVFLNRYQRSIVRKADQMSFFFFTRFIFIFIQQALEVAPPLYCFLLFLSASFDTFYYFLFQTFPYSIYLLFNFSFKNIIDFSKYECLGIWSELSLLEGGNFFGEPSFDENGCVSCAGSIVLKFNVYLSQNLRLLLSLHQVEEHSYFCFFKKTFTRIFLPFQIFFRAIQHVAHLFKKFQILC